jgi:hypothetical protein
LLIRMPAHWSLSPNSSLVQSHHPINRATRFSLTNHPCSVSQPVIGGEP